MAVQTWNSVPRGVMPLFGSVRAVKLERCSCGCLLTEIWQQCQVWADGNLQAKPTCFIHLYVWLVHGLQRMLLKVTLLHDQLFCVLWQGYKTLRANGCLWFGAGHWNTHSTAVGMKFLTIPGGGKVPSGVSHWGCAQLAGKYLSFTVDLCKVRGRCLGKAYSSFYGTVQPPILGVPGVFC